MNEVRLGVGRQGAEPIDRCSAPAGSEELRPIVSQHHNLAVATVTQLVVPEELNVNVGSQPHVESQVPAHVVGVVIDHNLVAVP